MISGYRLAVIGYRVKSLILLVTAYWLLSAVMGCAQKPYYKESRLMMGTIVEITCQDKFAINAAFEEIKNIERIADNFDPGSEISQLKRNGRIRASDDLLILVKESTKYYSLSNGAFDVTAGPIIDIWKKRIKAFEEKKSIPSLPSPDEIRTKLLLIGSNKILIDDTESIIRFVQPGMSIDLGAIAKGYAVDKAVNRLRELGIDSAMVNAGGNIYCLGKKGKRKWRIGIQHPRKSPKLLFTLDLENQAVATSGDYQQYFIVGGKRYSHIIDPKTGYPVSNNIISVTIIAKTATEADGLSTAVFVLGKEKGDELIKTLPATEAKIIEERDM